MARKFQNPIASKLYYAVFDDQGLCREASLEIERMQTVIDTLMGVREMIDGIPKMKQVPVSAMPTLA